MKKMINRQYQLDRNKFCEIFNKIGEYFEENGYDDFDDGEFKFWYSNDTLYVLDYDYGILISWYKHLGRCNDSNMDLSEEQYRKFAKKLEYSLNDNYPDNFPMNWMFENDI